MRVTLVLVCAWLLSVPAAEARGWRAKVRSFFVAQEGKPSQLQKLVMGAGMLACFGTTCEGKVVVSDAPLLKHGADPNVGLRHAIYNSNYAMTKLFLELGADDLDRALSEAINAYKPRVGMRIIDLLLSKGAKAQEEDKSRLEKLRRIDHQQEQQQDR